QGFYLGGGGIRDVEPDKIWPEDFIEDESAVHSNGLILGGALWDLRKALVAELGETDGHRLTEEIFVDMLRLTEDIPTSFEAALAADDDDGDLANGTPNLCPIYDAFDAHGLASGGLGRIAIEHEPIAFQPAPGIPIPVVAEIYELQAECSTLGDARLAYSLDEGGSWTEIAMASTGGDGYAAELPAMPAGTEIRYRIEADELDTAQTVTRPDNAAEPFYAIYVGPLAEILCDGFEGEDDGGWTHELLAGEDILGADDWQRDTPTGKGGDPEGAYAGESVWGNDLGLYFGPDENWNGKYQDGKINTLRSPAFDLSDYETVRLVFRRWLNVQDGNFDKARIYVNEQEVWSNFESPGSATDSHVTHHQDKEWILADIDISALAGGQAEVEIRFELQSNPGSYYVSSQYGGWTIDELCLFTADEEFLPQEDAGADAGDPDGDAGPVTATAFSMGGCGCDAAGRGTAGGSLLSAILGSF
ncbi:MAG: hypothetical protein M0R80_31580, partial [Proteobacteria bacterium]|nr:hypothetical protein [Pseudomonadota bacterium]